MAIPHYTYLVLKMPGPAGVITLRGDPKKVYECNRESCNTDDFIIASLALSKKLQKAAELPERSVVPQSKSAKLALKPEEKITKTIRLDSEDPAKVTNIGTQLDPK